MRNRLFFWKTCLRIRRQSENVSQDSKNIIKPMKKLIIFQMRSPSNPKTHNEDQQPKFQEFWFQHKQHNTFRSKCVCENGSANLCKVPFRFGGVAGELDWPFHHKMRFTYAPLMRHLCAARTRLLGLISGIPPPIGTMTMTMNGANICLLKAWSAEVLWPLMRGATPSHARLIAHK